MKWFQVSFVLLSAATILDAKLTVCVFDGAAVPRAVMSHALEEAERIFRRAGIDTEWLSCNENTNGIVLRIAPLSVAAQAKTHVVGFASPPTLAYVFWSRVQELSNGRGEVWAVLLGHAMAHEIGHLAGLPHTPLGIMRPQWSENDLKDAGMSRLEFSDVQARLIRRWLLAPPILTVSSIARLPSNSP